MKKIILAMMAIVAFGACSKKEKDLSYRGLSMGLPFQTFIDSLSARGFAVDSAKTDSAFTRVVMANPNENYRLMLAQKDGQLLALQENYKISTNDSTRQLWQQMRDEFEKELGVTAVISGCIVAPIVEELFFRYVLSELWFHEIDESRKEWIKLTVIGSLMWSLSHLNYLGSNVAMGIFIFFNGLLLYYILFRTRNIIYTIIIHAVNNLLTTILLPLTWNSIVKATGNNAVFIVITVLLTAAFVFCFYRISKNNTSDKKLETADNI